MPLRRYYVDVSALPHAERESIYQIIEPFSFMTTRVVQKSGETIGLEVFWDSSEDFLKSPLCPKNCPAREV